MIRFYYHICLLYFVDPVMSRSLQVEIHESAAIPGLLKIQIQSAYYEKLFLTSILSFLACFD